LETDFYLEQNIPVGLRCRGRHFKISIWHHTL